MQRRGILSDLGDFSLYFGKGTLETIYIPFTISSFINKAIKGKKEKFNNGAQDIGHGLGQLVGAAPLLIIPLQIVYDSAHDNMNRWYYLGAGLLATNLISLYSTIKSNRDISN